MMVENSHNINSLPKYKPSYPTNVHNSKKSNTNYTQFLDNFSETVLTEFKMTAEFYGIMNILL